MSGDQTDKSFDTATAELAAAARWCLACCLSRMEIAMEALGRAGFAVYCPTIEIMKPPPLRTLKPSQRKFAYMLAQPAREPLFPGYFLVGLGARDHHEIFRVCRIDGLRCEDGRPVPVGDHFLDRMRAIEKEGAIPGGVPLKLLLGAGDLVRVLDGPFTGHVATVEELGELAIAKLDESTRVWIALKLFGGATRVETTLGNIAKVE